MKSRAAWQVIGISCVGHFYFHYFAAMYYTIVVALTVEWALPYHELITLWSLGALLVALGAVPAGRLADRWSASGMMVIYFLCMGAFTFAAGFARDPFQLGLCLAGIGLFGAIYHPVGIPWMIRHTSGHTGKWLAVNGVFGGFGSAAAGGATALLMAFGDWRLAFLLPGFLCVLTGLWMLQAWRRGRIGDDGVARSEAPGAAAGNGNRGARIQIFIMLLFSMFVMGLIFNVMQAVMPQLFTERMGEALAGNAVGAGLLVSVVYAISAIMQLGGGWLADRFALKRIYIGAWILQSVIVFVLAEAAGLPLFLAALLLASAGAGALPAENMLLFRYAPPEHRSLAFGLKFILFFGSGPVALELIALARELTGGFGGLFLALGGLAMIATLVAAWLPLRRLDRVTQAVPAAAPAAAE